VEGSVQYRSSGLNAILTGAASRSMPETTQTPAVSEPDARNMTRTYVLVLVVEALVIFALWALSRYFG
jgi:hypothetical protein